MFRLAEAVFFFGYVRVVSPILLSTSFKGSDHQTFLVPKMEVFTYVSCMDTAFFQGKPHRTKIAKVQETLHFRYLKNYW